MRRCRGRKFKTKWFLEVILPRWDCVYNIRSTTAYVLSNVMVMFVITFPFPKMGGKLFYVPEDAQHTGDITC